MPRVICLLLVLAATAGCTRAASEPVAPTQASAENLVRRLALADHIPGAGLRWLVHLRLRALVGTPDLANDWSVVFQSDGVRAFAEASGIVPAEVSEVWIAGYDLGTLYLIDAQRLGNRPVEAFLARSMSSQTLATQYKNLTHRTGMIERTPHAIVAVEGHLVAIAVGDIQLARVVRAYAEGKLKKSPPALQGKFLAPCANFHAEAPLRVFFLGPFESATDVVTNGAVSGCAAVRSRNKTLAVEAQALGAWSTSGDLAGQLTAWTDQVLSTRELRALGWGFPLAAPIVVCDAADTTTGLTQCHTSGTWNSREIAEATYRVTAAPMAEVVATMPENWHPEATTRSPTKSINSSTIETHPLPEAQ